MTESFIKFLGTAGARFVVAKQLRASGGTFIKIDDIGIMLDPGPGTLVRMAKARPRIELQDIDAIILSHLHIDHSNDINILIDGMTIGGIKKRGILFAPYDALYGEDAVVFKYHRKFLKERITIEAETEYSIGNIKFTTSIRHKHPVETYGIKFNIHGRIISFMVDTRFFPDLLESYRGSDIIIMNVVRYPSVEGSTIQHLSAEDVARVATELKPKQIIMTHFGGTMLKAKPYKVAEKLSEETGIDIIAATDGFSIHF